MEKIPAACAMAWSIELEKNLRSKCPDKRIKAIERMGPILQTWSSEPNISRAVADMYGLVPAEDRTFANTILLRLANEFKCGDNYTRRCILKVFLLELPRISKEGKRYNGILAKTRVPNYVEMLKRVKVVYDTGDTEAKTLALRLFGCWADLTKDSAHVCYIILLSLQSSNVAEVKASLFAAGCLSLLSEDFACAILEMLIKITCLSPLPSDVSTAAIHTISRMKCSPAVASKAYKAGKKLLLGSLHDEFKAEMLSSLSKLAFGSTTLAVEQVELLLSFLGNNASSLVKTRALKCLYFLFVSRTCHSTVNKGVILKLFHIVDDNEEQVSVQCDAIRILCKVFRSMLPDISYMELLMLVKRVIVIAEQHSSMFKTTLLFQLLVHILCSLKRAERGHSCAIPAKWCCRCFELQKDPIAEVLAPEVDASGIAHQVTSVIADHITFLIDQMIANSIGGDKNMKTVISCTEAKQEVRNKLGLIQLLAVEYPLASLVFLNRMGHMLQSLENVYDTSTLCGIHAETSQKAFSEKSWGFQVSDKQDSIGSEIAICILRFTIACIKKLHDIGHLNGEICQTVKFLVESIEQSKHSDCATYELFSLCLNPYISCLLDGIIYSQAQDSDETESCTLDSSCYKIFWVNQEWKSLHFIRGMLQNGNYWAAYRAGKYCCLEGLWFAATFTFRKLIDLVESVCTRCWLKCLMLLAGSESEMKLLLFPRVATALVNGLQTVNYCDKTVNFIVEDNLTARDLSGWEEKFAKIYVRICSAEETLASAGLSDDIHYFQRWFLHLRAKLLETLVGTLGLLRSHELTYLNTDDEKGKANLCIKEFTENISNIMSGLAYQSLVLHNIAKAYDLLASSFLDIDSQSSRRISVMALSCSLLSFCTAFALHFPCLSICTNLVSGILRKVPKFSCNMILQDLIERFWTIDDKIFEQLKKILAAFCKDEDCSRPGSCMCISGHIERSTLDVCRFAISGILSIQEDAKGVKNEEALVPLLLRGLQLLSDVIRRWMEIPFQIPKYFFIVRPRIGAEIFILNADYRNKNEISISQGFQMSLNICIQLKNPSRVPCPQITMMYCILAARQSNQLSTDERREGHFDAGKIEEMVELNNMLLAFVKANTRRTNRMRTEDKNGDGWVTSCLSFEPNKKGQGFSSCLLDVSTFPKGSYEIKWHGCCIDENGTYWSLLPLTAGVLFTIKNP